MKILFLGEPESPNTQSWITGLRDQGCEVVLASVRTDGNGDALAIGNPGLPPRLRILSGVAHLKRIIAEIKPDILLAYRVTSYGYLAAKTGFHPLVIAAQNEQIVYLPNPTFLRRKFLEKCARYAIRKADFMHAWSENIAAGLVKFGADKDKILTLHRGIDMSIFSSDKKSHLKDDAPVFISTRSLAPEYRIENVIEAFSLLHKQIPGAVLKIVGSGSEESRLKQLASDLNLTDAVCFLGRLPHHALVKELKESDIYISVIETEGMSSSLIEAAVCGVLPIVSDMPASRLIVEDGVNGFLLRECSSGHLHELMLGAVSDYNKMRDSVAENSRKVCRDFDRISNQKIFLERYRGLIRGEK